MKKYFDYGFSISLNRSIQIERIKSKIVLNFKVLTQRIQIVLYLK